MEEKERGEWSVLKKLFAVVLALLLLAGCQKAQNTPPAASSADTSSAGSAAPSVTPALDSSAGEEAPVSSGGVISREVKDKNGALLMSLSVERPDLSGSLAGDALAQAEQYYDGIFEQEADWWDEVEEWARSDHETAPEGVLQPYAVQEDYRIAGEGDNYVSIVRTEYSYTGGAHGNQITYCEVFRKSDGKHLTLDMLFDTADYQEMLTGKLAVLAEENAAEGDYYENAGVLAVETFDPTAFYLSDEGMTFVYIPYSLAPYAAGTQFLTLPYAELPGFRMP